MSGFSNKPKILRGAFVEYGLSIPPLFVVFQFNPVQLSRSRNQSFSVPGSVQQEEYEAARQAGRSAQYVSLRDYHQRFDDLDEIRDAQQVRIQEESINFEIRLDATDDLNDGDAITQQFGISPQLSTLELMVHPKEESLLGQALGSLLGSPGGFSFTRKENPPLILFIWGRKRVLPVNISSLSITESEFSTDLNPIRAMVSVNLTVIEGKNLAYMYTKAMKEVMSVLNLANIADIADVVIPG
jgi:hypothetical protein